MLLRFWPHSFRACFPGGCAEAFWRYFSCWHAQYSYLVPINSQLEVSRRDEIQDFQLHTDRVGRIRDHLMVHMG